VIGAVLFGLVRWNASEHDQHRILLDGPRIARLSADYAAAYGEAPSATELRALARRYVDDEIDFREGMARGLDREDEVVRRRVIQKAQFLREDAGLGSAPSHAEVVSYYDAHKDRYQQPVRVNFIHVFFSRDHGEAEARKRAYLALARLGEGGLASDPGVGDAFIDRARFTNLDGEGLKRVFGDEGFVRAVLAAPQGRWAGPLRSAYGWHVVRVSARSGGGTAPLAEVEDKVRQDIVSERREAAAKAGRAALRDAYRVIGDQADLARP
jgi:hypothetical protein